MSALSCPRAGEAAQSCSHCRRVTSHHSVRLESLHSRHAILDRGANHVFFSGFLNSADEYLLDGCRGYDEYSVDVAEDHVAGRDLDLTDADACPEVDDFAAWPLVLRIASCRERWKSELQNAARVSRVAVDDNAGGPKLHSARGHQFAPERVR